MDDSDSDSNTKHNNVNTATYYQQRTYSYSLYKDYGCVFLRLKRLLR